MTARRPRLPTGCRRRLASGGSGNVVGCQRLCLPRCRGATLSFEEREEIALLRAQGVGVREIARRVGRSPSTISRELRRNAATRGGKLEYRASVAQWKAEMMARRPKTAKLAADDRLREYVQERLSGQVRRPDGTAVPGPATRPWNRRNKPRRQDRRWATAWSPEQISNRLKVWTSPMMSRCGSRTRRSIRRSMSRAAERSSERSSRACGPGGRCESRGPARSAARISSATRS